MKILLVEDEHELATSVILFLKDAGHTCDHAKRFTDADQLINLYLYDLVLLDLGLPDGNGLNLITHIKNKDKKTGIIIVSAKSETDQKVKGLELGADDYLTKPFHLTELNARINSLVRRLKFQGDHSTSINEIKIMHDEHLVYINTQVLDLTKKEFDLLMFLITNRNRVLTKVSMAEHLLHDMINYNPSIDFVYTHIKNLKKKMTEAGCKDYIKNIYGVGYKFTTD